MTVWTLTGDPSVLRSTKILSEYYCSVIPMLAVVPEYRGVSLKCLCTVSTIQYTHTRTRLTKQIQVLCLQKKLKSHYIYIIYTQVFT